MKKPTPKYIGSTASSKTLRNAADLSQRFTVSRNMKMAAMIQAIEAGRRTENSELPNREVESQISHATIGG